MGQLVDTVFAGARTFAELLNRQADFELLMPPQTNILCFRHVVEGLSAEALDAHQAEVRQRIVHHGEFHLTQVELHGLLWLRTTIMNPLTGPQDHAALIEAIRNTHTPSVL